jgi:hypothetical protein
MSGAESDRKKPPQSTRERPGNPNNLRHWESVYVCPKCGHKLNLSEIEPQAFIMFGAATLCHANQPEGLLKPQ